MIQKTLESSGHDQFQEGQFSSREWSAPTMVDPWEIKRRLASFPLRGRKITRLRLIGLSYFHRRDWIEDHVYDLLTQYPEEERRRRSQYGNIDPDTSFLRQAVITEPLLIELDNKDTFEICAGKEPEFRFSMNYIPWWLDAAGNHAPNVEANTLFAPCIGRTITSVELNTFWTNHDPMSSNYFDEAHSKRELVSNIVLRLDNRTGLCIGGRLLFCAVRCMDEQNQVDKLPFWELKRALFNWEDLHIDEDSGFVADSPTFFFGRVGANYIDTPFWTLSPGTRKSRLHIEDSNFMLFDLGIMAFTRNYLEVFVDYSFSKTQWDAILDEAEKLLRFASFDDLFDYLTAIDFWNEYTDDYLFLPYLNREGAEFWNNREKFRVQLADMREWSNKTLSDGETMNLYGC